MVYSVLAYLQNFNFLSQGLENSIKLKIPSFEHETGHPISALLVGLLGVFLLVYLVATAYLVLHSLVQKQNPEDNRLSWTPLKPLPYGEIITF